VNSSLMPVGVAVTMAGVVILRQVTVGRATAIATDTRDLFTSALRGDGQAVAAVSRRRGKNLPDADAVGAAQEGYGAAYGPKLSELAQSANGAALITEMKRLAAVARNRYVFGAEGPNAYDCSGLVWRAIRNLGLYDGSRFTTSTFPAVASAFASRVAVGAVGDVVLWSGHMGVKTGPDRLYSALNSRVGIVTTTITGTQSGEPSYWRLSSAPAVHTQN